MVEPEAILRDLLGLDRGLRREAYYGERAIFYNPGRAAPLGMIVASIKDRDGPNDRRARLDRKGVYRFAFCVGPAAFAERYGAVPPRPPKGGVVDLLGHDPTRLNVLAPHPVYAWMSWVQILAPSPGRYEELRPLVAESLANVRSKWKRRAAG